MASKCRWYEEILKHADDIAVIMTMECGKPLAESKGEVASGWVPPQLVRRVL
jgi:acyl-CoA reductase-like NAD-dependent aldehyde dehydrogenase